VGRRRFQLPGIHELSKEQEAVRAWPLEGRFLLTGGPGTGKSVMCLLRARRLHDAKKEYRFLVFNHLLRSASEQLFGIELQSSQWQSWFFKTYRDLTGQSVPTMASDPVSSWKPIDWNTCLEVIREQPLDDLERQFKDKYLIVDEGQDMPPDFYQFLNELQIPNLFVAADFNQPLWPENSKRFDIENAVQPTINYRLITNYRNSYTVARLAHEFYVSDPSTEPPELPPLPKRTVRQPILFCYEDKDSARIFRRLMLYSDRHKNKLLIGVLTPNNQVRQYFFNGLRTTHLDFENGTPPVSTHSHNDRNEIDFSEGGFVVINAQACKGLEFDVVFIAGLDQFNCRASFAEDQKRLFYVMTARAMRQVFMLARTKERCPIEIILPKDSEILERLS